MKRSPACLIEVTYVPSRCTYQKEMRTTSLSQPSMCTYLRDSREKILSRNSNAIEPDTAVVNSIQSHLRLFQKQRDYTTEDSVTFTPQSLILTPGRTLPCSSRRGTYSMYKTHAVTINHVVLLPRRHEGRSLQCQCAVEQTQSPFAQSLPLHQSKT